MTGEVKVIRKIVKWRSGRGNTQEADSSVGRNVTTKGNVEGEEKKKRKTRGGGEKTKKGGKPRIKKGLWGYNLEQKGKVCSRCTELGQRTYSQRNKGEQRQW